MESIFTIAFLLAALARAGSCREMGSATTATDLAAIVVVRAATLLGHALRLLDLLGRKLQAGATAHYRGARGSTCGRGG